MAGMRLPRITPVPGVERAPGGGFSLEKPQDPSKLIQMVLDLKQRQEDQGREDDANRLKQEQELARDFPTAVRDAREFQFSGLDEAADRRLKPHGIKLPGIPQVPGAGPYPEPVSAIQKATERQYHESQSKFGVGEGKKYSSDWLEGNRKRIEGEERYTKAQERAAEKERVRVAERLEDQARVDAKAAKEVDPLDFEDWNTYDTKLTKAVDARMAEWKKGEQYKREKAKALGPLREYRDSFWFSKSPDPKLPGESDFDAAARLVEEVETVKREDIKKSLGWLSPDAYEAKRKSAALAKTGGGTAPPAAPDKAEAHQLPDVQAVIEDARRGDILSQEFLDTYTPPIEWRVKVKSMAPRAKNSTIPTKMMSKM